MTGPEFSANPNRKVNRTFALLLGLAAGAAAVTSCSATAKPKSPLNIKADVVSVSESPQGMAPFVCGGQVSAKTTLEGVGPFVSSSNIKPVEKIADLKIFSSSAANININGPSLKLPLELVPGDTLQITGRALDTQLTGVVGGYGLSLSFRESQGITESNIIPCGVLISNEASQSAVNTYMSEVEAAEQNLISQN